MNDNSSGAYRAIFEASSKQSSHEARERFTSLLREHSDLLSDKKKFNSFLMDVFLNQKLIVNLLFSAYANGIADDIQNGEMDSFLVNRHVKLMKEETGFTEENARWAVQMWCECYGQAILGKSWSPKTESLRDEPSTSSSSMVDERDQVFRLNDFCGQGKSKTLLRATIEAAQMRHEVPGHILLCGPQNSGRYTLVKALIGEYDLNWKVVPANHLTKTETVVSILTNLNAQEGIIVRDIEAITQPAAIKLLTGALSHFELPLMIGKGPSARSINLDLPNFTLIATARSPEKVSESLRNCFDTICFFEPYEREDLTEFIQKSAARMQLEITPEGADVIADNCDGKLRAASRILHRMRDFAQVEGTRIIDYDFAVDKLQYFSM